MVGSKVPHELIHPFDRTIARSFIDGVVGRSSCLSLSLSSSSATAPHVVHWMMMIVKIMMESFATNWKTVKSGQGQTQQAAVRRHGFVIDVVCKSKKKYDMGTMLLWW
jgi:hypothetical protein